MVTTISPDIKRKIKSTSLGDKVTIKQDGTVEVLQSYFYRMGNTPTILAEKIKERLNKKDIKIVIIKTWDHHASFRGGASIKAGSHFGVLFKVVS